MEYMLAVHQKLPTTSFIPIADAPLPKKSSLICQALMNLGRE
jgi:hypothetical protein